MSDSLDDFFRDQQANVPPASPPPGQWERIRNGELVVDPVGKQPVPYWWLSLGLCFGLGLGVPIGAYFFSSQCPTNLAEKVVFASTVVTDSEGELSVQGPALSTFPAPAVAPEKTQAGVTITSVGVEKPSNLIDNSNKSVPPDTDVHDSLKRSLTTKKSAGEESYTEHLALEILDSLKSTEGHLMEEKAQVIYELPTFGPAPVKSVRFGSMQSTLVRTAAQATATPFEIKQQKPVVPTRWEFGVHVTPWLSNATTAVQTFSETMNDRTPQNFRLAGRDVSLYPKNSLNPDLSQRLQVFMVSLEVARQFPNGLRIGTGLAWQPRTTRGLRNEDAYLNAQLLEDEWARFSNFTTQYLSASLNLDYTFYRRRRFRPYVGVLLQSNFYSDRNEGYFLYERRSRDLETYRRIYTTTKADFGNLRVLPRAGFQYDVGQHFSIGIEVFPGVGIGGRYKL